MRRKKKAKRKGASLIQTDGILNSRYLDELGSHEDLMPLSIRRDTYVSDAVSTGSLVCDLITGGGWAPNRWITIFGPEASGKSTLLYQSLRGIIKCEIPGSLFDAETSVDPVYTCGILEIDNLDDIFGKRGVSGDWEIMPKIRYYQPTTGEPVFRYIHNVLKSLPDKLYRNGKWWLVFNTPPEGKLSKRKRKKEKIKISYDEDLLQETGKYWVPTEDGRMQCIWLIDSLPALVPELIDEDSSKHPQAAQARMYSNGIQLLRGKLGRKRCAIIAVNQLREKPGTTWGGNPEYEPGGNALRFYSDVRVRLSGIASPHGSGMLEEEISWDKDGKDVYRYVKIRTIKNKMFVPFRQSTLRIWVSHKGQSGYGFDPFWDTFQYLVETDQISGTKKGYTIKVPGPWQRRRWKWLEIKELILNPRKRHIAKKFKFRKPANLRARCRKQLKTGEAFDLYFKKTG